MCYFDLEYSIKELKPGKYTLELYREELKKYGYSADTLLFIATKDFEINTGFPMPPISFKANQSQCNNATYVYNQNNFYEKPKVKVYPNPFSSKALVSFAMSKPGDVTINIYNLIGNEVKQISNKGLNSGRHTVYLNSVDLPPGVYYGKIIISAKVNKIFKIVIEK